MTNKKRLSGLAAAVVLAGTATLVGGGAASAAQVGGLAVFPATDSTTSNALSFTTESQCPAGATNAIVRLVGSGITPSKANLMGNTSLSLASPSGSGYSLPGSATFKDVFTNNSVINPTGTYQIVWMCVDGPGTTDFGDFVGNVTFTRQSGDPLFEAAYTSSVPAASTTTAVSAPAGPFTFGASVTVNASVTPTAAGGTVQFLDNGVNIGTPQAVAAGASSFTTTTLPAGNHAFSATFLPANPSAYATSTSAPAPAFTVNKRGTSVALAPANGTSEQFSTATFTATASPAIPGNVQFTVDGGSPISKPVDGSGVATYSTNSLSVATHTITAQFVPTDGANNSSSTVQSVQYVVTAPTNQTIAQETINFSVPQGSLVLSVDASQDGIVDLGPAQLNATAAMRVATGKLDTLVVTDTRSGNPGWTVSGVMGPMTNGNYTVNPYNLGWTPTSVSNTPNQVVHLGATVAPASENSPGTTPATGLGSSKTLVNANAGQGTGTAKFGADLTLNVPTEATQGAYTGTLTFTVV